MTLPVDITDGCGLSNETCHELWPKKSKVMLFANYYMVKSIYPVVHANKMECFSFKSGCVMWVAKLIKDDWLIVLQ